MEKKIAALIVLSAFLAAIPVTAPCRAQEKESKAAVKKAKTVKGPTQADTIIIVGTPPRPQAAYILMRSTPTYPDKALKTDLKEKVISSVEDKAF
ncbi:MAG: hypothetical protein ABIJ56_00270 [Pseudomonadota bacterium]